MEDDQYNIIKRYPQQLATSLARTREKKASDIFNNAFSTASFTGGDSLPLCYSAHTVQSHSSTYSNTGTYGLSNENLEVVRLLMRDYVDDRGNVVVIRPDLVLIPPELEETMYEITKTPTGLDTANGNVNFLMGRYKYVVWDYLSDTNNWFNKGPSDIMDEDTHGVSRKGEELLGALREVNSYDDQQPSFN